jgi:hypothetical protein
VAAYKLIRVKLARKATAPAKLAKVLGSVDFPEEGLVNKDLRLLLERIMDHTSINQALFMYTLSRIHGHEDGQTRPTTTMQELKDFIKQCSEDNKVGSATLNPDAEKKRQFAEEKDEGNMPRVRRTTQALKLRREQQADHHSRKHRRFSMLGGSQYESAPSNPDTPLLSGEALDGASRIQPFGYASRRKPLLSPEPPRHLPHALTRAFREQVHQLPVQRLADDHAGPLLQGQDRQEGAAEALQWP